LACVASLSDYSFPPVLLSRPATHMANPQKDPLVFSRHLCFWLLFPLFLPNDSFLKSSHASSQDSAMPSSPSPTPQLTIPTTSMLCPGTQCVINPRQRGPRSRKQALTPLSMSSANFASRRLGRTACSAYSCPRHGSCSTAQLPTVVTVPLELSRTLPVWA